MDYQIKLDMFQGPMDLLLYLVKRQEVDICNIPIAKVADQFQEYLNLIQMIDMEWAGEFLVTAATLMEIKSRMLLPRPEEFEEEEEDPRRELVRQLLEYKKYKDAAGELDERAELQATRLSREPVESRAKPDLAEQPLHHVELWDLVSAFGRLMRETAALQPQHIVLDDTPIHVHMESIKRRLQREGRLTFTAIFVPPHTRGRLLGLFLAILELIKGRDVQAQQPDLFGEIWLELAESTSADR